MDRTTEAWLEALERRHLADFTMTRGRSRAARAVVVLRRAPQQARGRRCACRRPASARPSRSSTARSTSRHAEDRGLAKAGGAFPGNVSADLVDSSGAGRVLPARAWALAAGIAVDSGLRSSPLGGRRGELDLPTVPACDGRATRRDITAHGLRRSAPKPGLGLAILAAYASTELAPEARSTLLASLSAARAQEPCVLVCRTDCTAAVAVAAETGRPRSSGPAAAPTSGASARFAARPPAALARAAWTGIPASSRARSLFF